jgi:hypothetical protein
MGQGRDRPEPSLMHNIGAFFGHIVQAIKEDPAAEATRGGTQDGAPQAHAQEHAQADPQAGPGAEQGSLEVRREVQEVRHGEYLLRRTTIDEVVRLPEADRPDGHDETKHSTQ